MSGADAQGDDAGRRSSESEAVAGAGGYLLAGQASELQWLQLQSRVWEPSGRRLLEEIGDGGGAEDWTWAAGRSDGCESSSEWVGPGRRGDGNRLRRGDAPCSGCFRRRGGAANCPPGQRRPLRERAQAACLRSRACALRDHAAGALVRPDGDLCPSRASGRHDRARGSWTPAPALPSACPAFDRLIELIVQAFRESGGDWESARHHLELLRGFGIEGTSAPMSSHFLRGTRTWGSRCSSQPRSSPGYSRWWGRTNSAVCGSEADAELTTGRAGAPPSPFSSSGAELLRSWTCRSPRCAAGLPAGRSAPCRPESAPWLTDLAVFVVTRVLRCR